MKNNSKVMNNHFNLGNAFYDIAKPALFPNHILRFRNNRAAKLIGFDDLSDDEWINYFGKFSKYPGVNHDPLALKYHGHQFGHYNSELGDGRGFLLAQFLDKNKNLWDLGTKGSGQTKYSRGGDGRLTLKGAIRELLATEFLSALGVATSQTLSIIETEEKLQRNDEPSPTRSAVLVRRSNGHIRIGTFQRLAYLNQQDNLEILIDYLRDNYFTHINKSSNRDVFIERIFLECVKNIANSMGKIIISGFVHGVLNTDNFNVTGEVFDFGPWRFIQYANQNFTAAYFDYNGRYSFGRQPEAALWALTQLGKSFNKLINEKRIIEILNEFSTTFHLSLKRHFCWRIGIKDIDAKSLGEIMNVLLNESEKHKIEFASFFYDFFGGKEAVIDCLKTNYGNKYKVEGFLKITDILKDSQSSKGALEKRKLINNNRENMLIDEVEQIWEEINKNNNWELLEKKISKVRKLGNSLESQKLVNF
ncbi:YdiU family protein [Alphaproteobacteria bacterium]|nr:YdiU family protein [Alphaproteobacteria bacterium]